MIHKQIMFAEYFFSKKLSLPVKEYEQYALKLQVCFDGKTRSNCGGWHSENIVNENIFTRLKNDILQVIQYHCEQDWGYTSNSFSINNLWININNNNDFNLMHTHTGSIFSGVFYVKVPPHSGQLKFERGDRSSGWVHDALQHVDKIAKLNEYNCQSWFVNPEENLLIVFPSHQPHMVLPNQNLDNDCRISISFNVIEDNLK